MTRSRCKQVIAWVIAPVLVLSLGSNASAETGMYVFQYEVGFGGKRPASSFYLRSQSRLVSNVQDSGENSVTRIPLYSTDRNAWTLFRALQPRPTPFALEEPPNDSIDEAPASEDDAAQSSGWTTFGRVLAAGGALGVLVYLSSKEEKRECSSAEKSLCVVGAVAGGGGCNCKW